MKQTKIERTARFFDQMSKLGFSYSEAQSLRRIEMTLQRWGEAECNGEIERIGEEGNGYPVRVLNRPCDGLPRNQYRIPDRKTGALFRMSIIMAKHPELWAYHRSGPRGCQLYIGHKSDLPKGCEIGSCYTAGFACCI